MKYKVVVCEYSGNRLLDTNELNSFDILNSDLNKHKISNFSVIILSDEYYCKGCYGSYGSGENVLVIKSFDEIELFDMYHSGWAMVKKGKHLGFIDIKGKEVVPTIYDEVELFDMYHDGWAMVKKDNHIGFIDYQGKEVVPLEYTHPNDGIKWYNKQKNK